jgi:SAM-dependent methyltransferase
VEPATSVTHLHILAVLETELAGRRTDGPVRLLDAGCGDGRLMAYLHANLSALDPARKLDLHGFDVADSLTEHVSSPAEVVENLQELHPASDWHDRVQVVSVEDPWPYPEDAFDVVISNQVIEHVADLDFFFGELARTLRPGGFSVHVFPLRRTLMEWHLKLPIVHLIEDHRLRARAIDVFSRAGIGTYDPARGRPISTAEYGRTRSDFIQFGTFYRSWREVTRAAKHARLRATHRYTRGLYVQKARTLAGLPEVYRYDGGTAPLVDSLSFLVLPQFSTVTVVLEKPLVEDSWRAPGPVA